MNRLYRLVYDKFGTIINLIISLVGIGLSVGISIAFWKFTQSAPFVFVGIVIVLLITTTFIKSLINLIVLVKGKTLEATILDMSNYLFMSDESYHKNLKIKFFVEEKEYTNIIPKYTKANKLKIGDIIYVKKLGKIAIIDIDQIENKGEE